MTVKIKGKEIYAAYAKDRHHKKFKVQQVLDFINRLEGVTFSIDEFFAVIDAIKDNEPVELVEPKFLIYLPVVGTFCVQYCHDFAGGVAVQNHYLSELETYSTFQFTQEEVDKLKVTYPFIKTKEVEE